jgi:hypothetical protein
MKQCWTKVEAKKVEQKVKRKPNFRSELEPKPYIVFEKVW